MELTVRSVTYANQINDYASIPVAREGHVGCLIEEMMYIFGGGHSSTQGPAQYNTLHAFNTGALSQSELSKCLT